MTRRDRRRRVVPALLGLLALGQVGCDVTGHGNKAHVAAGAEEHGHGGEERKLLVTSPLKQDMVIPHDYVCQIHAIQRIEMRALERGYLQGLFVDEGKRVKEGQPMFQIMPAIYQAELDKAKAEVEAAEIEYNNTKLLAAKDVVSANELALAKAKLSRAKAELLLSETHLRLTTINAPFDGLMGLLEVRKGSLVSEGDLLTTLSDNSKMWVYFNVTEAEYLDYKEHADGNAPTKVKLVMANNKLFDQEGVVDTTAADFNNETGTIAFRATFTNPRGILRHGETGNVRIEVPIKDALVIPQKATFEVLDNKFVFVVDEHGVCHQRRVKIAEEVPHLYLIEEGLSEQEHVLLEGLRQVEEGGKITADYQAPAEVLKTLDLPAD
ncbi:MAG: efflux RND transporter periplasmic adaptor subunit [Planctomycetota bacterium]